MRRWTMSVPLDDACGRPLFLQLAHAIAADIRSGRLKSGEALPGSRELAAHLGVNRNTVVAGYGELAADGWIVTRIGGGTFVADAAPLPGREAAPARAECTRAPTFPMPPPPVAPSCPDPPANGALSLSAGMPDARLFPARELARAFRRAIGPQGRHLLGAADCCGHGRLRQELSTMLTQSRGLDACPDNVMVTRSIEQAIDLVARTLLAPGDVVAVEAFGYPPAWNVLRLAGAALVPLPLDDDGLDVGALEALLAQRPVRAVFVTPHHQFPTASTMSLQRRVRLAQLALQYRFAIIEDDYDHEFHYATRPVRPIAAGSGRANVVYIGSLANLLAPGIGTGFVVAPPAVFAHLRALRAASDARNDAAIEFAIAELFADGELLRHVRRLRRAQAARRDALAAALRQHLGGALSFRVPAGGMAIWALAAADIDIDGWQRAGEREGVQFHGAQRYDVLQRPQPFLRLNFAGLDERELGEAARRMARALTRARTTQLGGGHAAPVAAAAAVRAPAPRQRLANSAPAEVLLHAAGNRRGS